MMGGGTAFAKGSLKYLYEKEMHFPKQEQK